MSKLDVILGSIIVGGGEEEEEREPLAKIKAPHRHKNHTHKKTLKPLKQTPPKKKKKKPHNQK